ncbi:MAG TPA: hypothetical protein VMU32_12665 [Solirubrobacteraceae bacterium]|nr:hypothetical protein [Solirubrobacteraceae bacterium]
MSVMNDGAGESEGTVTVTDVLPAGVTAVEAGEIYSWEPFAGRPDIVLHDEFWDCTGNGGEGVRGASVVTCVNNRETLGDIAGGGGNPGIGLSGGEHLVPHPLPQLGIRVQLPSREVTETNHVTIAGGGAPTAASTSDSLTVTPKLAPFGFADAQVWMSNANGTLDTQAGSHPYEVTFVNLFNDYFNSEDGWSPAGFGPERSPAQVREIVVKLPAGFAGEPGAVPTCTHQQLDEHACPPASQLGIIAVEVIGGILFHAPVYNMVAPAGYPDEIAFIIEGNATLLNTGVRSGSDYGLTTRVPDITEKDLIGSYLTLWGVPDDPTHDIWRNQSALPGGCSAQELGTSACPPGSGASRPFLTMPTSCGPAPDVSLWMSSWQNPDMTAESTSQLKDANGDPADFTGCEHLSFSVGITTDPDTTKADTPAGLTVEVKPAVGGLTDPEGLSTSDIQDTTVTLPEGFVINPGQATGLQACGPAEDGLMTQAEKERGEEDNGPPSCPGPSQIGEDEIETPLLKSDLKGDVYLLQSQPPELKLLVAASGEGVNLKLVGVVHLDERTGQLTTKFEGTPELPFTDFKLAFSGGARAALATPTKCGVYGPAQGFASDFTPWASPFDADISPGAEFEIASGSGGGPCPGATLPFAPELIAGATTDQAGGYTDFSMLLRREDDQQRIAGLQFKAPNGLTGFISHVPLCTNAQAESNSCPEASKIGHAVVESGPGPYPLVVPEPGQPPAPIYLTESYDGAPFGLSIVVPLRVGPFVLPTQRVRARIEINPQTSALTVTTGELPQEVSGVPTDLREVDAVIERPEFMVNPTNCDPQEFSGTAYGTAPPGQSEPDASASIGSHFQVGACQALKFEPKITISTNGRTSRADGASLDYKVTYPDVPQGTESNIGYVKVELPRQLPSRLPTLQKACTEAQFHANPAGCPAASVVGHAVVQTALLPVALQGPIYFVSNGNESFPNLVIVLEGEGVTIELVGDTFISNSGITSTTFHTVPDDQFSSFELVLPQGPYSALAANQSLCDPTKSVTVKKKVAVRVDGRRRTVTRKVSETKPTTLRMPNEFVGQDGAVLKRDTALTVTGCPTHAKKAVRTKKKDRTKKKKRRRKG